MNLSSRTLLLGGAALAAIIVLLGLIVWLGAEQNTADKLEPEIIRELVTTPFEEQTIEDNNLFTSSLPVRIQVGIPGITEELYEVTRDSVGNILDKKLLETNIQVEKKDRITRVGTLDREAAEKKIRATLDGLFTSLDALDFKTLYPLLASIDRMYYTELQLSNSAKAIGLDLDTYSITGEISYLYPKYLSDKDATLSPIQDVTPTGDDPKATDTEGNNLIAVIPISLTFNSSVIGTQGIAFDLKVVHENGDWFARYFGPTEVLEINQTRNQSDGGKVFGAPVGASVKLNRAVLFPYIDRLYFDYELANTSTRNFTVPLRTSEEPVFIPTDAFISRVTLYDEPDTPYTLLENILYNQSDDTVWVDKKAAGRLIYEPTPGLEIARIYLSMQLTITNAAFYANDPLREREATAFVSDIDFGEIALKRQNRQAEYERDGAIRDEDQTKAIQDALSSDKTSTPDPTP